MSSHVTAFAPEGIALLHDHDPLWSDEEAPEGMLARFASLARDSKGQAQKAYVIELR
jgi:hypothetical protein